MRLLAAGCNAHGQLNDSLEDVTTFTEVTQEIDSIQLSTWSTLTWTTSSSLVTQGHQASTVPLEGHDRFHSVVGDHNGVLGLLCGNKLWSTDRINVSSNGVTLRDCSTATSPSLSHIAVASNGQTVAIHQANSTKSNQLIVEAENDAMLVSIFPSFEALRDWYSEASLTTAYTPTQYTLEGIPRQFVAGATSFALLTKDGSVYTWGEARRCSLGRSIVGEAGRNTAHEPGLVQALAGVQIEKICHGGWMFGAISADGAAYLWGLDMPRSTNAIGDLGSDDEVTLIELAGDEADEPDVVDMDIGEGHAALVTSEGLLYVMGENSCGQLGRAVESGPTNQWICHGELEQVTQVVCGPDTTIVLAR